MVSGQALQRDLHLCWLFTKVMRAIMMTLIFMQSIYTSINEIPLEVYFLFQISYVSFANAFRIHAYEYISFLPPLRPLFFVIVFIHFTCFSTLQFQNVVVSLTTFYNLLLQSLCSFEHFHDLSASCHQCIEST